ncbi:MAG: tetraacyldisaccharide 4'-kinase [Saprospiraceae bacterium]
MIQNVLVKILLAPFSMLYGLGISLRDFFYRKGYLKGIEFDIPIISVGNLSVGGAGKSPHIEYLIRCLKPYLDVATLSRGYKRKTKGFLLVSPDGSADIVGDEPLQFKRKFPEVLISVAEDRIFAIPEIMKNQPTTQVILLDDAYQHRSIKPGLNILLTEYASPFTKDYLLPSGRLREWRSAYRRADIIIISKCPPVLSKAEKKNFIAQVKPYPHQRMFFTYYKYQQAYRLFQPQERIQLSADMDLLLICAIARTDYLLDYLEEECNSVKVLAYEDHHYFSKYEVSNLKNIYDKMPFKQKIILTTEKDAMRLELHREFIQEHQLPIFVLPIEVDFHFGEGNTFDEDVKKFLLNFRA